MASTAFPAIPDPSLRWRNHAYRHAPELRYALRFMRELLRCTPSRRLHCTTCAFSKLSSVRDKSHQNQPLGLPTQDVAQ